MLLEAFISLFISTAFAQAPDPKGILSLHGAPAVMVAIAKAESGYNQYTRTGKLLCDGVTGTHCGLFQIGDIHRKDALKQGWDINTPEGNIAYALYLYSKEGTQPWVASYKDPSNPNSWGQFYDKSGKPIGGFDP